MSSVPSLRFERRLMPSGPATASRLRLPKAGTQAVRNSKKKRSTRLALIEAGLPPARAARQASE